MEIRRRTWWFSSGRSVGRTRRKRLLISAAETANRWWPSYRDAPLHRASAWAMPAPSLPAESAAPNTKSRLSERWVCPWRTAFRRLATPWPGCSQPGLAGRSGFASPLYDVAGEMDVTTTDTTFETDSGIELAPAFDERAAIRKER